MSAPSTPEDRALVGESSIDAKTEKPDTPADDAQTKVSLSSEEVLQVADVIGQEGGPYNELMPLDELLQHVRPHHRVVDARGCAVAEEGFHLCPVHHVVHHSVHHLVLCSHVELLDLQYCSLPEEFVVQLVERLSRVPDLPLIVVVDSGDSVECKDSVCTVQDVIKKLPPDQRAVARRHIVWDLQAKQLDPQARRAKDLLRASRHACCQLSQNDLAQLREQTAEVLRGFGEKKGDKAAKPQTTRSRGNRRRKKKPNKGADVAAAARSRNDKPKAQTSQRQETSASQPTTLTA